MFVELFERELAAFVQQFGNLFNAFPFHEFTLRIFFLSCIL